MSDSYDRLYKDSKNFQLWGDKPGRLIAKIKNYLDSGEILDAGCGDGKNALYLEKIGFSVTGYDSSSVAIKGLKNRFLKNNWPPKGIYKTKDLAKITLGKKFDVLVSYGLLHALPKKTRIATHLKLEKAVKSGGFLFFTCLTDKIPLPSFHRTKNVTLAGQSEINRILQGWKILYQKKGEIKETHPNVPEHKHNAYWVIAQKMDK